MSTPQPFTEVTVADVRAETPELTHLDLLAPSAEFLSAYTTPGQYVQIKIGENKPGFFALASAPGEERLSLLIKRGNPTADTIVSTPAGGKLQVSVPSGKGYPFELARGCDVFLIGVGSGIAPLRSVVRAMLKDRDSFRNVRLIYGARTSTSFPYAGEMQDCANRGIEVCRVCSQPHANTWNERVGRVQQALLEDFSGVSATSVAFVCGMKAMVEDVKNAFGNIGMPPERVYQNF